MVAKREDDYQPGHPKRFDYDPESADAREWARINVHPRGERDFPVDHPKALDTPGNLNALVWEPGIDAINPQLETFTGRPPEMAAAAAEVTQAASAAAMESPAFTPVDAVLANAALAQKRKDLRVEVLTYEQTVEVLASLPHHA